MYGTTPRKDYLFGEDFVDGLDSPAGRTDEEIKKAAHVVNGGEVVLPTCLRCNGTGQWRGYARTFPCRGCSGTGRATVAKNAAVKGAKTKEDNRQAWMVEHKGLIDDLTAITGWNTYASELLAKLAEYGTLRDWQVEKAYTMLAKIAAKRAERAEARVAAAPKIEMAAIEKLFATATDNDVKRPIFRFEGGEISKAPVTGRNAGALYVKDGDAYCGKIVGGKFHAAYGAPADMADRLMAVAADPTKAAMAYGRRFGRCGICGKGLVDPISIRAGLGPICSDKFGLDWKRELAREELTAEKAEEILATRAGGQ